MRLDVVEVHERTPHTQHTTHNTLARVAAAVVSTQLVLFVDALLAVANVERGAPREVGRQNGRRGVGVASPALRPHRALHLNRRLSYFVVY